MLILTIFIYEPEKVKDELRHVLTILEHINNFFKK